MHLADHSGFAKARLPHIGESSCQLVARNRCEQGATGLGIDQQGLMGCIGLPLQLNPLLQKGQGAGIGGGQAAGPINAARPKRREQRWRGDALKEAWQKPLRW